MPVECRGRREDADLELAFRRATDGANLLGRDLPFSIVFADKKTNSTGLQIADLVSHPVGRHHLNPVQPDQAHDAVAAKLWPGPAGDVDGWGLKVFP